jgi:hypothetical protein
MLQVPPEKEKEIDQAVKQLYTACSELPISPVCYALEAIIDSLEKVNGEGNWLTVVTFVDVLVSRYGKETVIQMVDEVGDPEIEDTKGEA